VYAFFSWSYVAVLAVFRPDDLPRPLTHWAAGPRTDTFGAACFAVSFLAYVAGAVVRERRLSRPSEADEPEGGQPALARALIRAGGVYGAVAWAYIAMNAVSHPRTLSMRLTHLAPWPTEGDFGVTCFVVSAVCHLLWQVFERPAAGRRTPPPAEGP
jgi:hypothetical protein